MSPRARLGWGLGTVDLDREAGSRDSACGGEQIRDDGASVEFLEVVGAGLCGEIGPKEVECSGVGLDDTYGGLVWIMATLRAIMATRGESVATRDVLTLAGILLLGWNLEEEEALWRVEWARSAGIAEAFVHLCEDAGFDVIDMALQEQGVSE